MCAKQCPPLYCIKVHAVSLHDKMLLLTSLLADLIRCAIYGVPTALATSSMLQFSALVETDFVETVFNRFVGNMGKPCKIC